MTAVATADDLLQRRTGIGSDIGTVQEITVWWQEECTGEPMDLQQNNRTADLRTIPMDRATPKMTNEFLLGTLPDSNGKSAFQTDLPIDMSMMLSSYSTSFILDVHTVKYELTRD